MTQSQLQSRSKVSRSYLSRIESGQMTPSLGTLEKISEALNVGLNRFFIPESDGEALLEDPFIQGLRPFLRQLDWEQWQSILKRLQAISDHVNAAPITLRPIGNPARLPQPAPANGNGQNGHIGHASHSNGLMPAQPMASAGLSAAASRGAGISAAVGTLRLKFREWYLLKTALRETGTPSFFATTGATKTTHLHEQATPVTGRPAFWLCGDRVPGWLSGDWIAGIQEV